MHYCKIHVMTQNSNNQNTSSDTYHNNYHLWVLPFDYCPYYFFFFFFDIDQCLINQRFLSIINVEEN